MHFTATPRINLPSPITQTARTDASGSQASGGGFQITNFMASLSQPRGQSLTGGMSPLLGSQTSSSLLQLQDLNQTQPHGGGGGHHSSMKMMASLEAEEAAGTEETQSVRQRKKLATAKGPQDINETVEVDENGEPLSADTEQSGVHTRDENHALWSK